MILNLDNGKCTDPMVLPMIIRLYRSDDIFLKRLNGLETVVILCGDEMNMLNRFEITLL